MPVRADKTLQAVTWKDADLAKVSGKLLHVPTTIGAVVLTYNVPGVGTALKLTPDAVAGIYLGRITSWSDRCISCA